MSCIHVSENANSRLLDSLAAEGHSIALQRPCSAVSEPISAHVDIFLCKMGTSPKSPVFRGDAAKLAPKYPADVLYNAVVTEEFLICNTRTVSDDIPSCAKALYPDIRLIHVPQGYTKCNMVVVDDRHFITEDEGIAKALDKYRMQKASEGGKHADDALPECITVRPGFVDLPGYDRGFIGGASGRIGNEIWFNGDISEHPDCEKIIAFIESCGLTVKFISGSPLTDIGSIIEEVTDND